MSTKIDIKIIHVPNAHKKSRYSPRYINDGSKKRYYESDWGKNAEKLSFGDYILADLSRVTQDVSMLAYSPRQDGRPEGNLAEYRVYVSVKNLDGIAFRGTQQELDEHFTFAAYGKTFFNDDIRTTQTISFKPVAARYVALQILDTYGRDTVNCSELEVFTDPDVSPCKNADKLEKLIKDVTALAQKNGWTRTLEQIGQKTVHLTEISKLTKETCAFMLDDFTNMYNAMLGKNTTICNGMEWYDTEGLVINAHGGGVLYDDKTKTYFWYGEDKTEDNIPDVETEKCVPATGIHCYSSKDLTNWKNEGIVMPVFNNIQLVDGTVNDPQTPLYVNEDSAEYKKIYAESPLSDYHPITKNGRLEPPELGTTKPVGDLKSIFKHNGQKAGQWVQKLNDLYKNDTLSFEQKRQMYLEFNWNKVIERPKVVYNKKTEKYVMYWHHDGDRAGLYWQACAGFAISDSPTGPFKYLGVRRLPNEFLGSKAKGFTGMLRDMTLFVDDDGKCYLIYSSEHNRTTIVLELDENYTGDTQNWTRAHSKFREAPAVMKYKGVYYMVTSGCTSWNPNPSKYHIADKITGPWKDKGDPCVNDFTRTTFRSQSTFILQIRDKDGNLTDDFIYMGNRWLRHDLKTSKYIWLPVNIDENGKMRLYWKEKWEINAFKN